MKEREDHEEPEHGQDLPGRFSGVNKGTRDRMFMGHFSCFTYMIKLKPIALRALHNPSKCHL